MCLCSDTFRTVEHRVVARPKIKIKAMNRVTPEEIGVVHTLVEVIFPDDMEGVMDLLKERYILRGFYSLETDSHLSERTIGMLFDS